MHLIPTRDGWTTPSFHLVRPIIEDATVVEAVESHRLQLMELTEVAELEDYFESRWEQVACLCGRAGQNARTALLRAYSTAGIGVIIEPYVHLRNIRRVVFGNGVFIGAHTTIYGPRDNETEFAEIGEKTWIGPGCILDARALRIGKNVGIGPGVTFIGSQHSGEPVSLPVIATNLVIQPIEIGDGADIGANTVILPGVSIGPGAIIGANSLVNRDIEPNCVAFGVPCRVSRER